MKLIGHVTAEEQRLFKEGLKEIPRQLKFFAKYGYDWYVRCQSLKLSDDQIEQIYYNYGK